MVKSYCVKQKKQTECVALMTSCSSCPSGTRRAKNGRLMFVCTCAECECECECVLLNVLLLLALLVPVGQEEQKMGVLCSSVHAQNVGSRKLGLLNKTYQLERGGQRRGNNPLYLYMKTYCVKQKKTD